MKLIFLPVLCCSIITTNAQQLRRPTINAVGNIYNSANFGIRISSGEPVVGDFSQNGSTALSQGFFTGFSKVNITDPVDSSVSDQIVIYPNPVKDMLFFKGNLSQAKQIQVFNITGHCLFARDLTNGMLQVKDLPKGFYVLKLMHLSGKLIAVFKIVKL